MLYEMYLLVVVGDHGIFFHVSKRTEPKNELFALYLYIIMYVCNLFWLVGREHLD